MKKKGNYRFSLYVLLTMFLCAGYVMLSAQLIKAASNIEVSTSGGVAGYDKFEDAIAAVNSANKDASILINTECCTLNNVQKITSSGNITITTGNALKEEKEGATATIKRDESYRGRLIVKSGSGSLTFSDIIIDGGAEWNEVTGKSSDDEKLLGRGLKNIGVFANDCLICNEGSNMILGGGCVVQNQDCETHETSDYTMLGLRGAAVYSDNGILTIDGAVIKNNYFSYGTPIFAAGNNARTYIKDGLITSNFGLVSGAYVAEEGAVTVMSGGVITKNMGQTVSAILHQDALYDDFRDAGDLYITGGKIIKNWAMDEGAVMVQGLNAKLHISGAPIIRFNFDSARNVNNNPADAQKNIMLAPFMADKVNISNLSQGANIGVNGASTNNYAEGDQFGDSESFDSGTLATSSVNASSVKGLEYIHNDVDEELCGAAGANDKVVWKFIPICKVVDPDLPDSSPDKVRPFASLRKAVEAVNNAISDVRIEMLIPEYEIYREYTVESEYNVLITTAKTENEGCKDGYPYRGDKALDSEKQAKLTRYAVPDIDGVSFTGTMFRVWGNVEFSDITIDGGAIWSEVTKPGEQLLGHGLDNSGIVASSALILADGGDIKLSAGTVIQNNSYEQITGNKYTNSDAMIMGTIVNDYGTLVIDGAVIKNNYNYATIFSTGDTTMISGEISGNNGYSSAGIAVFDEAAFNMKGGSIKNNIGVVSSAAVAVESVFGKSGNISFTGSPVITNNVATGAGTSVSMRSCGAVYISDGSLSIEGSPVIRGNYVSFEELENEKPNAQRNVYLLTANDFINVTANLDKGADVGVTDMNGWLGLEEKGNKFGLSNKLADKVKGLNYFHCDVDDSLAGGAGIGREVIWCLNVTKLNVELSGVKSLLYSGISTLNLKPVMEVNDVVVTDPAELNKITYEIERTEGFENLDDYNVVTCENSIFTAAKSGIVKVRACYGNMKSADTAVLVVPGDVDKDGKITLNDAVKIAEVLGDKAKYDSLSEYEKLLYNMNNLQGIDVDDIVKITSMVRRISNYYN